ncbi:MAG: hypothetical protein ACREN4_03760 [Candidatus Dormibacteria bacterium]
MVSASQATSPQAPARFSLLSFAASSRRVQVMLLYGAAVLIVGTVVTYLGDHQFEPAYPIAAGVLALMVLLLQVASRRHAVTVEAESLRIGGLLSSEEVPFAAIRLVRVQPLHQLFDAPSRRSQLHRSLRAFRDTPACRVRVDLDLDRVQRFGRLLGRGTTLDHDLILLVAQAQELEQLLQSRMRRRPSASAKAGRRR